MSESQLLARSLLDLAEDRPSVSGVLHRAARRLLETDPAPPPPGVCRCGKPIPIQARGRPRKYCHECSPPKKPGKSRL